MISDDINLVSPLTLCHCWSPGHQWQQSEGAACCSVSTADLRLCSSCCSCTTSSHRSTFCLTSFYEHCCPTARTDRLQPCLSGGIPPHMVLTLVSTSWTHVVISVHSVVFQPYSYTQSSGAPSQLQPVGQVYPAQPVPYMGKSSIQ